ncbi:MAG: hypothetical protein GY829_16275 [Gammaproteobacteria bacterium]|nr:hypothetical protein [Gammaproteobacteria bacterium]
MSNKKNSCCDCCDDLKEHPKWLLPFYPRLTLHKMEADSKKPEWYERKPFKRTLCWVSNTSENTAKDGVIRLVTGYDGHLENPFCVGGGYWRYAIPTPTKKNVVLHY